VKLLLDMNLSPEWVPFLADAGHTAVHWSAVGRATASDAEIMNWARSGEFVVFTNDLDFSALLAMTRSVGPSVLQVRLQDLMSDAIGHAVLDVLEHHGSMLEAGAIVTLTDNGTRVRVLPLHSESS
jgi:predicted nuclease of predicted toxin-antitoxin system